MAFHRSIIGKWRLPSLNRYTQKIQRRKCLLLFERLISIDNPSHNICFSTIKKHLRLLRAGMCVRVGACKFPKCKIEVIIRLHFKHFKLPQWRWAHNLSANSKNVECESLTDFVWILCSNNEQYEWMQHTALCVSVDALCVLPALRVQWKMHNDGGLNCGFRMVWFFEGPLGNEHTIN